MTVDGDAGATPARVIALVVGLLAFAFVAAAVALQFGDERRISVLTVPLVLVVPAVAGVLYWLLRRR